MGDPSESVENTVRRTVRVLLPLPLAGAYDYSVPEGLDVAAGQFVVVPLGKRETVGVVWGEGTGEVAVAKLRDVIEVLPALPMADAAAPLRRLGRGLHAGAAGRRAAHGDERARRRWRRPGPSWSTGRRPTPATTR